jgi:impB/mucB/samB family
MFVFDEATMLHADLDAFYASVEQRDDPRLRGRPVIVGAGVVLSSSYEARACGVRTAMGGRVARRLCPHAVVVDPRFSAYTEASRAVFAVFDDTTPWVEGISIDEAFLEVGGLRRVSGTPKEIAMQLRRDVLERVGLPITVGVARTKFLAKVASGIAKPDGLARSSRSCTRCRSAGSGASVRSPRRSWRRRASPRSRRSRASGSARSSRCSAPRRAGTSTRSRTTATRVRSRPAGAGARSVRSTRWGGGADHSPTSTRSSSASPTGSRAGCGPRTGSAAL